MEPGARTSTEQLPQVSAGAKHRRHASSALRLLAGGLVVGGAALVVWGAAVPAGPSVRSLSGERIDFGVVDLGVEPVALRHTLRYRNVGWSSIGLAGTASTCGCTALTPEGSTIEPGEELAIEVQMTLADAIHRDSGVKVAFDNGQLFVHEFHALGARAVSARLLSGPLPDEGHAQRIWLLATTASAAPPAPPHAANGGLVRAFDQWQPVGGGATRAPHHWMTSALVEFDPAEGAAPGGGGSPTRHRAPLVVDVGPQPVRIERPRVELGGE